jgi:hypothetical protein
MQWFIYYSGMKKTILMHADTRFTWMNFENIMLSERNQEKSYILSDSIYMKHPESIIESRLMVVRAEVAQLCESTKCH